MRVETKQTKSFSAPQTNGNEAPRLASSTEMGLRAKSLSKAYKKRPVLRNVSFKVDRGEAVGLLGPNGAGKTTSFYCITGHAETPHHLRGEAAVLYGHLRLVNWLLRRLFGLAGHEAQGTGRQHK